MKKEKIIDLMRTVIREELATYHAGNNMKTEDNETLSRQEVMKMLNISSTTFWKHIKDGTLPSRKIGRKYIFLKSEILQLIKEVYN